MTAIAFDGAVLAVDRAESWGGMRGEVNKMRVLSGHKGNFLAAFCGSVVFITQMVEYFNSKEEIPFPDIIPFNDNGITSGYGLMWNLNERAMYEISGGGVLLMCHEDAITTSGCVDEFLYGAMIGGLNSVQAISKAHVYTAHIGFGVDHVDVYKASEVWEQTEEIFHVYNMIKRLPLQDAIAYAVNL